MQKRSHRHLVAVPATLLLLLGALSSGLPDGRAEGSSTVIDSVVVPGVVLETTAPKAFSAVSGVRGILEAGRVRGEDALSMELLAGSVTVRTAGAATMKAGADVAVHGVRTAWYVLREDAASLVVALASPIAVTARGQIRYLLAGEQIRIPDGDGAIQQSTVPRQWLQQRLAIVAGMPADAVNVSAPQDSAALSSFAEALQAGRMHDAAAFMHESTAESYLRTERLQPFFATMLAIVSARAGTDADAVFVGLELTKALPPGIPFGHLLALSYASGMVTDMEAQHMLASQFAADDGVVQWAELFLRVEGASRMPLPDAFIARWSELLERIAVLDAESAARLSIQAAELSVVVEERGYPIQAGQWAQASRKAAELVRSVLPRGDRDSFDMSLAAALHEMPDAATPPSQAVASSVDQEPQQDAKELVARTKDALSGAGGMFATTTSFVVPPREPNAVRVLGVIFATSAGDASFDLTYHPMTGKVDKIVLKGHMFPNALSLQQLRDSL